MYFNSLVEKETIIGKLRTEVDRLKFNTKLANAMLDAPASYNNINDVTNKRAFYSITNLKRTHSITIETQDKKKRSKENACVIVRSGSSSKGVGEGKNRRLVNLKLADILNK